MVRRGSSMFVPGGAMPQEGGAPPQGGAPMAPAGPAGGGGGGGGPKRQSVVLQPMAGGLGLSGLDDSDFDDSEDEAPAPAPAPANPNHRPLVGGFAAAAYEAARADHLARQAKKKAPSSMPTRRPKS